MQVEWIVDSLFCGTFVELGLFINCGKGHFVSGSSIAEDALPQLHAELLPPTIKCPHCNAKMDLDDQERAIKKFECPACKKQIDFSGDENPPAKTVSMAPQSPIISKCCVCGVLLEKKNSTRKPKPLKDGLLMCANCTTAAVNGLRRKSGLKVFTLIYGMTSEEIVGKFRSGEIKPLPPSTVQLNNWARGGSGKSKAIVILVGAFLLFLVIKSCDGTGTNGIQYSKRDSGTIQNASSTDATIYVDYVITERRAVDAAENICGLIWDVAQRHKSSSQIDVTVFVDMGRLNLVDSYGKRKAGVEKIEEVTTDNLSEVRKYARSAYQGGTTGGASRVIRIAHQIADYRLSWFEDGDYLGR